MLIGIFFGKVFPFSKVNKSSLYVCFRCSFFRNLIGFLMKPKNSKLNNLSEEIFTNVKKGSFAQVFIISFFRLTFCFTPSKRNLFKMYFCSIISFCDARIKRMPKNQLIYLHVDFETHWSPKLRGSLPSSRSHWTTSFLQKSLWLTIPKFVPWVWISVVREYQKRHWEYLIVISKVPFLRYSGFDFFHEGLKWHSLYCDGLCVY